MNRNRSPAQTAHSVPAPANQSRPETQAANKQLASASSGEYAESVAEDWTPEDDSPPDTPDRSAPLTLYAVPGFLVPRLALKPTCKLLATLHTGHSVPQTSMHSQRLTS